MTDKEFDRVIEFIMLLGKTDWDNYYIRKFQETILFTLGKGEYNIYIDLPFPEDAEGRIFYNVYKNKEQILANSNLPKEGLEEILETINNEII